MLCTFNLQKYRTENEGMREFETELERARVGVLTGFVGNKSAASILDICNGDGFGLFGVVIFVCD